MAACHFAVHLCLSLDRQFNRKRSSLVRLVLRIDGSLMGFKDPLRPEEAKPGSVLFRGVKEVVDALKRAPDSRTFVGKRDEDVTLLLLDFDG